MAFKYSDLTTTATRLITDFGQAVTFTRNGSVNYDPTAGVTSSSQSTYDAKVVLDGNLKIELGETTLAGKDIPASVSSTTAPKIGDTATINSENYRVTEVNPLQPAATVIFYDVRLRS